MWRSLFWSALLIVASGCSSSTRTSLSAEGTGRPAGPTQAPGRIDPDAAARAADFSGSCAWARPPGPVARYQVPVRVRGVPSARIPVRADTGFDPARADNIIGRLTPGSALFAEGPLYDAATGQIGYAVLVRGVSGRVCRGYLRAESVAVSRRL